MAGQKRSRPGPESSSGPKNKGRGQPKATVFRKSAKKQKTDNASAVEKADERVKPRPAPQPQRKRPKDQPKPKTKHEFIKAKQEAARKEKEQTLSASKQAAQEKKAHAKAKAKARQTLPGPATLIITPPPATSSFYLVAGSYERILYGLEATIESAEGKSRSLSPYFVNFKPIFTFPAHVSSIRTAATAGPSSKWLVTGGTDEVIKLWDLRKRREVGQLTGHEGTITSLVFASKTYLLTTGADANINLYRTRDWALLRTLKGHIGRINSAAPHPTGRLALSVGSDRTIRMWDLMRGRAAASTRIGIEADLVRWDTKGTRFAVLAYRQAMIFKTDMTKIAEIEDKRRIGDVQFARVKLPGSETQHELLFAALEDGTVKIYDLDAKPVETNKAAPVKKALNGKSAESDDEDEEEDEELEPLVEVGKLVGHKNRVKAVSILPVLVPETSGKGKGKAKESSETDSTYFATTISSDGFFRVFDLTSILAGIGSDSSEIEEVSSIGEYDTKGTRLTCLTAVGKLDQASLADDDDAAEVIIESDDEEDEDAESVDEVAEDEELKELEEAIKAAQAQGIKLEDLEDLLDADDIDFDEDGDDEGDSVGDDDDDEEEEEEDEDEQEEE